jgi:hypothetical protein
MTDWNLAVSNMSVDDLFISIQPDEKSRQEAREWIRKEKLEQEEKERIANTVRTIPIPTGPVRKDC